MSVLAHSSIRTRLTFWYVSVLAVLLLVYATIVFAFQYATLTRQIFHDEVQDVETVEGLLYFDSHGTLQLRQDYYSRPQSHLLIDRMMEVRDPSGSVVYRSSTLQGQALGGPVKPGEGDDSFNERFVRLADGRHVFLISHIHGMAGRLFLIRLGYDLAPLRARMVQFLILLIVALPTALAIAAVAGRKIAMRALRPLEEMTVRAQGIGAANLRERLSIANPRDELGQLASVFNDLLQRLEDAFEQLYRFTADAAHELRTPLAAIRTVGEVTLETASTAEGYRDSIGSILEASGRLNETIDSLLLLARAEVTMREIGAQPFAIGVLMEEVLGTLEVLIEERQLTVERSGTAWNITAISADRSLLRVALLNVTHNAIKFSPSQGTLRIGLAVTHDTSEIIMTIEDDGPGLTREEMQRVFERFYRGSAKDGLPAGTGLGLSIAKLILERSGGDITFDPDVPRGARCVIRLPLNR